MIGVFGGTFDPPHLGHSILALEAVEAFRLERLLWVLTATPPHKLNDVRASLPDRFDMVGAAVTRDNRFELSRADIDRPGPHYALGTMHWLKERNPDEEFLYLIGGDSLRDLRTWYRAGDFLDAIDILGVMARPGAVVDPEALERDLPGITDKLKILDAPMVYLSASEIRRRVALGLRYDHLVLSEVAAIIVERGLYQSGNHTPV